MLLNGKPVVFNHPIEARAHGVATIYQEFSLVPTLTVAENIFLGRPLYKAGSRLIDWDSMRRQTVETLGQLEIQIDPDAPVRNLSVAEQQLVEIAKAISLESSLLIMDEPTAALGMAETERLLELVRRLAAQGKAILYISHRLDEVFEVADVVTVLKDGRLVATRPVSQFKMNDVVRMMIGMDIEQHYPKISNVWRLKTCQPKRVSTASASASTSVKSWDWEGWWVPAGRKSPGRSSASTDARAGPFVCMADLSTFHPRLRLLLLVWAWYLRTGKLMACSLISRALRILLSRAWLNWSPGCS
jgi:ABC-type sugar transport system ATPase subunit